MDDFLEELNVIMENDDLYELEHLSNLDKSIIYLIKSLKEEKDTVVQDLLGRMLVVRYERCLCSCGQRHDRICDRCEEVLLCDKCDEGTHDDERSVCYKCRISDDEDRADYYERWG